MSVATVGLINAAFTWGFHGVQYVVMSSVENIAYGALERERSFQHGPLSLTVRDVQEKRLIEPTIKIQRRNAEPVSITAREAVMSYSDADQSLKLQITNGCANIPDKASFYFPDTFVQTIPLSLQPPYDLLTANPSHMPMGDLPTATIKQSNDIRQREGQIAVHAGFSILASRLEGIVGADSSGRQARLAGSRRRLSRLHTKIHRRWASGFTCLALAMVGIPFAIRLKTSDTMTTFGIVFVPTLLFYYPIFALTLNLAKDGHIAPCGVWLANGIFVAISLVMMRKTIYSPA